MDLSPFSLHSWLLKVIMTSHDRIVFDGNITITQALAAIDRGDILVCPKCGTDLVVAMTDEDVKRLRVHRGIFCGIDRTHLAVLIDVVPRPGFWEQFKKK